jgi:uncharacterized protein YkwD
VTLHLPRRRTPALILITLGISLAGSSADAGRRSSPSRPDGVERALVRGINSFRHHYGLGALHISGRMSVGADRHSRSMARGRYIGHGSGWDARARSYSHARHVGEVVDYVYRLSPRRQAHHVLSDWVHSGEHRSALLTRDFSRAGVGRARSGPYVFFTVDMAGRK